MASSGEEKSVFEVLKMPLCFSDSQEGYKAVNKGKGTWSKVWRKLGVSFLEFSLSTVRQDVLN